MIDSKELARAGCKYLGTSYSTMDCQKFWEQMLRDCGLNMDLGGSNSWYRHIMNHGWCGTPEECKQKYGCIPQGATLFIREDVSESTPEKFRHDGIGDITHMGDYTAMTGDEMCQIAKETGVADADKYNFGNGAIHSSSSRNHVSTSKFQGKTIPNGGWNRVGLFTEKIKYPGINDDPEPGPDPEPEPPEPARTATVWSENGKPVNTRKGPNETYGQSRAGTIPVGDTVQIDAETTNDEGETWCKCQWTTQKGVHWKNFWVKKDFLIDDQDEPEPDPTTTLYTVHIPFLTADKAKALIRNYPGSWKTVDEAVG